MNAYIEGEFFLRDFSPQGLTFIPDLNCVLASDRLGHIKCIDVLTGEVLDCTDISLPSTLRPSPLLLTLHPFTGKLVTASADRIGGRCVHKGCVLLKTILQTPAKKSEDEVVIEIPMEQVPSLLKELQKSLARFSLMTVGCVKSIIEQLTKISLQSTKCSTATFTGNVGKLGNAFSELLGKLKSSSQPIKTGSMNISMPLIACLGFRLHLLHPENYPKISKLEAGEMCIGMSEGKLMHVEALRRLSLSDWPHNYQWAVPRTMSEAGFYHLTSPQTNTATKGDRVTCFACRVYLYSWDPTDEPWSEHERHAIQCPYIRGEYTENVPLESTEASHPAHVCAKEGDRIVCLGTSMGTELVAVGTEQGHIILLDLDHGLLIMETARLQLTSNLLQQWIEEAATIDPLPNQDSSIQSNIDGYVDLTSCQVSDGEVLPSSENSTEFMQTDTPPATHVPGGKVKHKPANGLDSEIPTSKHNFYISALSVAAQNPDITAVEGNTTVTSTPPPDSSCSLLVTGVTTLDPKTQTYSPSLIVHHIKTGKHSTTKTKISSLTPSTVMYQSPDFLDMADPLPNPVPLSTVTCENLVTVDFVNVILLKDCVCSLKCQSMPPEITQVIPLDRGKLFAVACSVSNKSNQQCVCLMLYKVVSGVQIKRKASSSLLIESSDLHICPVLDAKDMSGRVLLASLSGQGEVVIYDCTGGFLEKICVFQCDPVEGNDMYTSCSYCSATGHLFVSLRSGKVFSLRLSNSKEDIVAMHDTQVGEKSNVISRMLALKDLDDILNLVQTSTQSVPFSCLCPVYWKEISLLQLNRRSPLHINVPSQQTPGLHTKPHGKIKNVDNSRIYQYEPPLESLFPNRYTFEIVMDSSKPLHLGCVCIRLTFANTHCISSDAKISLLLPEPGDKGTNAAISNKLLCGPIKLKPLIDITEQSIRVFLMHPLLLHTRNRVLLLSVEHLFSSEYKDVSFFESNIPSGGDAVSRRQAWRNRGFRHQVHQMSQSDTKYSFPVQANLIINVFPLAMKPNPLNQPSITFKQLIPSIHDPTFILRIITAACRGRIEGKELKNLPEDLQSSITEGAPLTREIQQKAFDVLLWMGGMHCVSADYGGYALMASAVEQLLLSLVYCSYVEGNRVLAHKCSRLLVMLYRHEDDSGSTGYFRFVLSESLTRILPLLPLFSSASCVHWFLRLLSTLTGSCDSPNISTVCLQLLVELSAVLSTKNSLPAQILQTNFKHESSVFEPELFDIYLSYCQKSSSVMAKSKPMVVTQYGSYPLNAPLLSTYTLGHEALGFVPNTSVESHLTSSTSLATTVVTSSAANTDYPFIQNPGLGQKVTVPTLNTGVPAGTTHIVTDKGGHTIYDSELQLLLDTSKKTESQGKKFIEDFMTYKHGSFLLYSQRGLLESLPLTYTCVSVTGNAMVLEPSIHMLPHMPENQHPQLNVSLISKTYGYNYPDVDTDLKKKGPSVQNRSLSSSHPIPQVLADINTTPKELMMQIEILKSGVAYSAFLRFPQPVMLTDISIPATGSMASVSVDVWLNADGESESVRVAHSSEIKTKSLMLGNLTPPPVCQYAKVTFLGSLVNTREMTQVFIGAFYGIPLFSPDQAPSVQQLKSLEDNFLSQYYHFRDGLTSALLSYASLKSGTQSSHHYKEKVNADYQQCFKMQVCLARLRNFMKNLDTENDGGSIFQLPSPSDINYNQCSISKLNKMIGCLVDTLLALNMDAQKYLESSTPPRTEEQKDSFEDEGIELDNHFLSQLHLLTEAECRILFNTLCIHGIPKMHARAIALLIKFGGSQKWWGDFIVKVAEDLFRADQSTTFSKERALLQLSALSQHTYTTSDLLPCLLNFLQQKLSQFTDQTSPQKQKRISDHTLLRWVLMLLSHFLSSIVSPNSRCSLFVPLPTNQPTANFSHATEGVCDESKEKVRSKEMLVEKHKELKKMFSYIIDSTTNNLDKKFLKQEYDSKLKEYRSLHHRLSGETAADDASTLDTSAPSQEPVKLDLSLFRLSQDLCHAVIRGLAKYVLVLCGSESDVDFIPVVGKCISLLLSCTKWSYPIHTLVTQEELHLLFSYSTSTIIGNPSSSDSMGSAASLDWRRRTIQNLIISMLYYGEVKPCQEHAVASGMMVEKPKKAVKVKAKAVPLNRVLLKKRSLKSFRAAGSESRDKKTTKVDPVPYNSFIISNIIESRTIFKPESSPELQLQKIAKGVYGSILLTLLNARPLSHSIASRIKEEEENQIVADSYLGKIESINFCVFPETVFMLVQSLESLLNSATNCHQLLSNTDLVLVLSLWHELNTVLMIPKDQLDNLKVQQITSENCFSLLVNFLLDQTSIAPTLWQASLVNIIDFLRDESDYTVDYDKLLSLLVKFFVSGTLVESGLIEKVACSLMSVFAFHSKVKKCKLHGSFMLLEILLMALQKSDRHLQDYTLLYELAKTFGEDTNYEYFWFFQDSSLPHVFHLLHDLCELVTKLILNVLSEDVFPGVELYGSEFEDVSRRKHYSIIGELYKRTWTPTNSDKTALSKLICKLLQILKEIFSFPCRQYGEFEKNLKQFCEDNFSKNINSFSREIGKSTDYLATIDPEGGALPLVYVDSDLLFKLLQILNLLTAHVNKNKSAKILPYEEFILFIYSNCHDKACFFQPIQRVLDASPGETRLSKLFILLITRPPSSADSLRWTSEFIQQGGGLVVLKCLINSSKQAMCVCDNKDFSSHAINKLGHKDTPTKTINESSNLVDLFPLATTYIKSSKGTVRVSHTSRSLSLFQCTYSPNEKWVQLHIVFPHPILLHNFICCVVAIESGAGVHSGPSKIFIECSVHGGLNSTLPITPVFKTDSLKIINVAFHQPVLVQQVVVHFHRPLLSNTIILSKAEVLGTNFGSVAETIGPNLSASAQLSDQQEQEQQGADWLDIVDRWLKSSESAKALVSLFGDLPDLLPSCLALLNTGKHTNKKFIYQLENLMIAITEACPDHGMTILHHLLGFSSNEQSHKTHDSSEKTFSLRLLSSLCKPTSSINRERLATAIRLISNLPPSHPPPTSCLPHIICSLSSLVWHGTMMNTICLDKTFHSLVELVFSLEPGSRYKMSLNALVCTLCHKNSDHFTLLLASCENVLVSGLANAGCRLNTLAQAAQSSTCSERLLKSEFISKVISRLTNGFEKLLDLAHHPNLADGDILEVPLKNNARDTVSYLCSLLAFFTDFLRNWRLGKVWMADDENHRFWPPIFTFFSMNSSILSPIEMSFFQEVVYEYFSVCLQGCDLTKKAFVQLLCDSLYKFSSGTNVPNKPVLTPFLHKLLGGLIFQHESIPIILRVVTPPPDSWSGNTHYPSPLTLSSTFESQEFHPSYPIGESYYYLHVPGSFTLAQFESLVKSHHTLKKTPDKVETKSPEKASHRKLAASPKPAASKPPTQAQPDNLEIAHFELKSWKTPSMSKENQNSEGKGKSSLLFYTLKYEDSEIDNVENLYIFTQRRGNKAKKGESDMLCDIEPKNSAYPMTVVLGERVMIFNAKLLPTKNSDTYNMFVSCNGLLPLAESIPALYPYHWPGSLVCSGVGHASGAIPTGIFKSHAIIGPPAAIPFHSLLMVGLCLQLEEFGKVLGQNPSAAFIMMRLLLGEESTVREPFPKVFTDAFSYLPYLIFLETLRKFPATTEAGRTLRIRSQEVGVFQLVLQCLSSAGHHSPRIESDGDDNTSHQISLDESMLQPKNISSSVDKQYWAKGTGFGTGSTASSFNMVAIRAKHKSEEKYVSICFSILTEYFSLSSESSRSGGGGGGDKREELGGVLTGGEEPVVGREGENDEEDGVFHGEREYCTVELIEVICKSCMLPALASYLLNDSVLDISKHIELYQSTLSLVSSIASNPATQHLLTLPVFSAGGGGSSSEGVTSLSSLIAKLRDIAIIYQKTAKLKQPKSVLRKAPQPPKRTASLGAIKITSPPVSDNEEGKVSTNTGSISLETKQPMEDPSVDTEKLTVIQKEAANENDMSGMQSDIITSSEMDESVINVHQPTELFIDDLNMMEEETTGEIISQLESSGIKDVIIKPCLSDMLVEEQNSTLAEGIGLNEDDHVEDEELKDAEVPTSELDPGVESLGTVEKETLGTVEKETLVSDEHEGNVKPVDTNLSESTDLDVKVTEEQTLEAEKQSTKQEESPNVSSTSHLPPKLPPLSPPPSPPPAAEESTAPTNPPPLPPRVPIVSKKFSPLQRQEKPVKVTRLTSDEADLVELVNKILSVSDQVTRVIRELKREAGSYSRQTSSSTPLIETPEGEAATYMAAMKPLQFDTYQLTGEDENGKLIFNCPFHYQSQVETAATSMSQDAARARRLAQEISTLSSSLPLSPSSSVFVRCDEERLDVMKVLITGPSDTPYANGCFEFDVFFPTDYPKSPMLVNLKTTGHGRVRFNPNLYNDGKVCLSVLNTWHGRPEEKWNGQTSSLLQVLVSIQSLILVPEPYFNEPGYEQSRGSPYGDQKSLAYNSNISVATIQWAMINQIRNPMPCFKQVILQHFYLRKDSILSQCEVWKVELEEAIKKIKQANVSVHLLREHLYSLVKSIETLRTELDKIKTEDFQSTNTVDEEES